MTSSYRFVFIVTYGRSGSTLLQSIIGSIPGYHICGENRNALFGLYQSYAAVSSVKAKFRSSIRNSDDPWYGVNFIDPDRYGQKLAQVFIEEIINPPNGTRVLGFKEIRYFQNFSSLTPYLNFMAQIFSPAKFVFNAREPEEVAKSGWWNKRPEKKVVEEIKKYSRAMESYASAHAENCLMLHYNDYINDSKNLGMLFDFLEEPFDQKKVENILSKKLPH